VSNNGEGVSRRSFLEIGIGGLTALGAVGATGCGSNSDPSFAPLIQQQQGGGPATGSARAAQSLAIRVNTAQFAFNQGVETPQPNGDEQLYPKFIANFSKTLPHNAIGEVDPAAYQAFVAAATTNTFAAWEAVPGGPTKLGEPMAGVNFDLQGPDAQALEMPAPPTFASAEQAAEMVECYWLSLIRDVPFTDWPANPIVAAACAELSSLPAYRGIRTGGLITPATFDRIFPQSTIGPFVSQLLINESSSGAFPTSAKIQTVLPNTDFLKDFASWLAIQNGAFPVAQVPVDPTLRFIRNVRDLTQDVREDYVAQEFIRAAVVISDLGENLADPNQIYNVGNPYRNATRTTGFVTFALNQIIGMIGECGYRAMKAQWYQKFQVHRRLRPEEYGGRVEVMRNGLAVYPIHADLLNSQAVARTLVNNGTALLPIPFATGCPAFPSYGSGHSTYCGACATILKAFFNENFVFPNPQVPTPDGVNRVNYGGADAGQMTLRVEIDKLADNVSGARQGAGVHYRSDSINSLLLGERMAIGLLQQQKATYPLPVSFVFTGFLGNPIVI